MRFIRSVLVVLVVCAAIGTATAQTGGLKVVVVDESDQPLPAATVILSNDQGFIKQTAMLTDADGTVLFPVLRAGPGYVVDIQMPTFMAQRHDVRIKINEVQTLPIKLTAEFQEQVVVVANSNVVELDKHDISTKFSDDFIQDLPVPGRFYQGVLTMAPGVQDDNGDGEVTVHGSRSRDFKAMVGGVSNVDPLTGQTMGLVNPNSIEEMEVITAGAGVEYGRAQGGFANIIQKQGSNEFEGLGEIIFRSGSLDGNGAGNTRDEFVPDYNWYQPSVQVSGPIIKDKLWYRLSHEYIFREQPINTGAAVEVTTTEQGINSDQLTWQVSPRNKLAFNFDWNPLEIDNVGVTSRVGADSSARVDNDLKSYRLTWTAPFSPKIYFESLVSYQDSQTGVLPSNPVALNSCITDATRPLLAGARCNDVVENLVTGAWPRTTRDNRQRFTLRGQANLYVGQFLGANHQVKTGFQVENERYFRAQELNPTVTRFFRQENATEVEGGEVDLTRQEVYLARFSVPRVDDAEGTATIMSFFVEDQIKPLQNLTIKVGVAVDRESTNANGTIPFDPAAELDEFLEKREGLSGLEQTFLLYDTFTGYGDYLTFRSAIAQQIGGGTTLDDIPCSVCQGDASTSNRWLPENVAVTNTNFSPRISLSWDPWSNVKTKISASAGRYYNNIPLIVPMREQDPTTGDVELICLNDNCQPAGSGNATPTITIVDRGIKTPYQDEWTLSFERELFAETLMRVTYINREYRDQIQDVDINHQPGDFGRCVLQTSPGQPVVVPVTDPNDPVFGLYPNGGDGIIDDCQGRLLAPETDPEAGEPPLGSGLASFLQRPDGLPDLYIQNPFFGDIYLTGNFNAADYEGVTLEVIRRQYQGWEMQGSYTYSEAVGNGEDFFQQVGDDISLLDDEFGYQSTDRRHVVKVNATTITPWGFRFGTSISWQSGLPYSILRDQVSRDAVPPVSVLGDAAARRRLVYPTGVRNDQRNLSYWNVDIKFTKEMRVGQRANVQLSAEVYNLLNDDTYQVYNPNAEIGQQLNGINDGFYRFGRNFQLGAKVTF